MKRLMIMTVGKTHSGKTTFARMLEQELDNSLVIDQDNHAEFINTYYKKLQPKQGANSVKHAISQVIADVAINETDFNLIICNSNLNRIGRMDLLNRVFTKEKFIQIIVHFDLPDEVLQDRVLHSERSTNVFRVATSFEEVLLRQKADSLREDISDPNDEEADHLFVIREDQDVSSVVKKIVRLGVTKER